MTTFLSNPALVSVVSAPLGVAVAAVRLVVVLLLIITGNPGERHR